MYKKYYFLYIQFQFQTDLYFDLMENSTQISQKLSSMLEKVSLSEGFDKFIEKLVQKINFQKNNILNLTPERVGIVYNAFKNKLAYMYYTDQIARNLQNSTWVQNQLRAFIYILCVHLYLEKMSIQDLKQEDYEFLHIFFPNKLPLHLEYQIKLLLNKKNTKWSIEESLLFQQAMRQIKDSKRWNFIAKQLFIRSNKKYFKTPKQCRQRWINHLDPKKIKGSWQNSEDLMLLRSVSNFGKKWTLVSRQLNETRTQNSVKNRYNSLIKIAKKRHGFSKNQLSLLEHLIQDLNIQNTQQQIIIEQINDQNKNRQFQKQEQALKINKLLQKITPLRKQEQMNQFKELIPQIQTINSKILQTKSSYNQDNDFKYVFDQSQFMQNIAWNNSTSFERVDVDFYLNNGSYCFQHENSI